MGIFNIFKKKVIDKEIPVPTQREKTRDKMAASISTGINLDMFNQMYGGSSSFGLGWYGNKFPDALEFEYPLHLDIPQLRTKSRNAVYKHTAAAAIFNRLAENVVNFGLKAEPSPVNDLIELDPDKLEKWKRKTEARFRLWCETKTADIRGLNNFYQLQYLVYKSLLKDGEFFVRFIYSPDLSLLNPLRLQIIKPEQVQTPDKKILERMNISGERTIFEGIEYDKNGAEIAYYIKDFKKQTFSRVPKIGARSKRILMTHGFRPENVGQTRGVPLLAGILHELEKLSKYSTAEIQAALVNASIALWIKPSSNMPSSKPLSGIKRKNQVKESETDPSEGVFIKPGMAVQNLKAGEEIQGFDTKRPNVNFDAFRQGVLKSLSSSLGMGVETLEMVFGSNYSASRAALVLFWNTVTHWRSDLNYDFNDLCYEMHLQTEIESGRAAPANFETPLQRAAWINVGWIGINRPNIDPKKEADADTIRLNQGAKTRDMVAHETNGSDFDQNVDRLKFENIKIAAANQPLRNET